MTAKARELETVSSPDRALMSWLREAVAVAHDHRGVVAWMMAAIADADSSVHASCVTMRAAGMQLLIRAQSGGVARTDIDRADLFALVGALAWLRDQPSLGQRADHLFIVIASAILTNRASSESSENVMLPSAVKHFRAFGQANLAA